MKILLIEDDAAIREVLIDLLESSEYEVATANNGAEAIVMLKVQDQILPDLILLDMHMPVMNGDELLRVIKSGEESLAKIPVVIMSATANLEKGLASAILKKPMSMNAVLETVANFHPQSLRDLAII